MIKIEWLVLRGLWRVKKDFAAKRHCAKFSNIFWLYFKSLGVSHDNVPSTQTHAIRYNTPFVSLTWRRMVTSTLNQDSNFDWSTVKATHSEKNRSRKKCDISCFLLSLALGSDVFTHQAYIMNYLESFQGIWLNIIFPFRSATIDGRLCSTYSNCVQ